MRKAEDTIRKTVCRLITAAMFGTEEEFSAEIDWDVVHEEMYKQTIHGLVYDLLPSLPISGDLREKWQKECLQVISKSMRLAHHQMQLTELLEKENIPYMILKGNAAAMYYPNPILRTMGDVDFYVASKDLDRASSLMKENGYQLKYEEDFNPRHIGFGKDKIVFELHRSFSYANTEEEGQYVDALIESNCTNKQLESVTIEQSQCRFSVAPELVNGLILLEHIASHLRSGLGLRQIIDWMMFVNGRLDDAKWLEFQPMASKAGLETLAKVVTKICCRFLGLKGEYDWCLEADDQVCEELISYLFRNGNFGKKAGAVSTVAGIRRHYKTSANPFRSLQEAGVHNWGFARRHAWARPFAWVYQIIRYIRKTIQLPHMLKTLKAGSEEAVEREKLMKDLGIS